MRSEDVHSWTRRDFTKGLAAAGAGVFAGSRTFESAAAESKRLLLGIDNFAVRAMGWKGAELIDYAAGLDVDSLFITDLEALESFEEKPLGELKQMAADKGLRIYLGSWSICPTSVTFKDKWGTAEEHLALGIRVAGALGSPVFRVILGSGKDRLTEGGIEARIEDTVQVLKASRNLAVDSGVKIAVENHAGDMHSSELAGLIEAAGSDFVGANMDSGNAVWTLEDPLDNLEILGPHVLTTSLRDTAIWKSENGVTAQWTAMGEGDVDWEKYFQRFAELCPEAPVHIETISGFNRELAVGQGDFWKAWPGGKPGGYERFLEWASRGSAREARQRPEGVDPKTADREYQRGELERSIAYCKSIGLGRR